MEGRGGVHRPPKNRAGKSNLATASLCFCGVKPREDFNSVLKVPREGTSIGLQRGVQKAAAERRQQAKCHITSAVNQCAAEERDEAYGPS